MGNRGFEKTASNQYEGSGHEIVIVRSKPAWRSYLALVMLGGFVSLVVGLTSITVALVVTSLWVLTIVWLRARRTYTVTSNRIIVSVGLIGRTIAETSNDLVLVLKIVQTPMERLLGVGSVLVVTAGEADGKLELKGVASPERYRQLIRSRKGNG